MGRFTQPIRLLIQKKPKLIKNQINSAGYNLIDYQNELTKEASKFKGFISSQSFCVKDENYYNFCTSICNLSLWNSEYDWNNWINSSKRKKINNKYTSLIHNEQFQILLTRKDFHDIPLL
tara:strand:+ start:54 stop:413 length:360 start_codon:yes stop_codon:yes gene_type:complete